MHCTAYGKAALAQLVDETIPKILGDNLRIFTTKTIGKFDEILNEISRIRETSLAIDIEEHTLGICALGMAFKDRARQVYAVSMPIPTVRFATMRARCEPLLVAAVQSIKHKLEQRSRSHDSQ